MTALLIRGGRLIDGTGREPLDKAALVIQDGRIVEVGPVDLVSAPRDARVVDADGLTIMPGLVDIHTHLTYHASQPNAWRQEMEEPVELTAVKAAANARAILEMGFTTVADGGCRGLIGPAIREAVVQGVIAGPRIVAAGQILCGTAGLLDSMPPWVRYESDVSLGRIVDGPADVRRAVREQVKGGVDFIKVAASGVAGSPFSDAETEDLDVEEMRAAVVEAARHRRWVHAHAHSAASVKAAVAAGVRSIHSGEFADDEALLAMRERGVPFAVTIAWLHARSRPDYVLARDNPAFADEARRAFVAAARVLPRARELGVKVAIGTDAAHRFFHAPDGVLELEYLQALGYPALEVLRAATWTAAEAIVRDDVGALTPGKAGDVLLIDGDPAEDVGVLRDKRRIVEIFKAGEEQARGQLRELPGRGFDVVEALAREGFGPRRR